MVRQISKIDSPGDKIRLEQTRLKKKLDYNDKTFQHFLDEGFDPTEGLGEVNNIPIDKKEREFLQVADVSKEPIRRKIVLIKRVKEIDLESPKRERKEFLIWLEEWEGVDFKGAPVPPWREHWEGYWQRIIKRPITDPQEHMITAYEAVGLEKIYDTPFNQANVDRIIKSSVGSDKETIKFFIEDTRGNSDYFTYEQFVGLPWDECQNILLLQGGARQARIRGLAAAAMAEQREQKNS